ncbi:MAG: RT0821/Lpp0805 family surface protein [Burkholderiales bacterium]|nr:RT0821/Lpp0805 family surface protein [Burkholderiales bacterium]
MGQSRREKRTLHGAFRRVRMAFPASAVIAAGLLSSGCSMTFPIGPLAEPETTGSIVATPLPALSPDLGGEDLVYAEDAMDAALDPLGTAATTRWANPKTGRKGTFAAAGEAFVREDEVCRYFRTTISLETGQQDLLGLACRAGAGHWQLRKIRPAAA